jgi:hypothetical protein
MSKENAPSGEYTEKKGYLNINQGREFEKLIILCS